MEIWMFGGIILLLSLLGGAKGGEETTPPNGGGSKPPPDLPPSTVPSRRRGAGGRGQVWGSDSQTPSLPSASTFNYAGNGLWIDPSCGFVIEGDLFWPKKGSKVWTAVEAPTLDAALAKKGSMGQPNSVIGFVDYLVDSQGYQHPENVVWEIVKQAAPMCEQVDSSQWGEAMRIWFNDFLRRVTQYMDEDTIGGFS